MPRRVPQTAREKQKRKMKMFNCGFTGHKHKSFGWKSSFISPTCGMALLTLWPLLLSASICLMDHGGLDRGPCRLPTIHTLCHTHWMCFNSNVSFCTHGIYSTCPSGRGILLCCSSEGFFPFFHVKGLFPLLHSTQTLSLFTPRHPFPLRKHIIMWYYLHWILLLKSLNSATLKMNHVQQWIICGSYIYWRNECKWILRKGRNTEFLLWHG